MVTIREGGTARRGTAAEAFLLKLTQSGLGGNSAAARDILDVIEQAKDQQGGGEPPVTTITWLIVDPGSELAAWINKDRIGEPEHSWMIPNSG
jgi:hypothetical protein